jgi:hypothetical protein
MKRKTNPSKKLDSRIDTYSGQIPKLPADYRSLRPDIGPFYDPYRVYRSGPEPSTLICTQRGYIDDTPGWKREGWIDVEVVVPPNSRVIIEDARSMCGKWNLKSITITPPSDIAPLLTLPGEVRAGA